MLFRSLAIAAITGTEVTIVKIGNTSLQGDARFAREVLEPMGCEVIQTETETTVRGPPKGTLKSLGYIDMEPMTDAFLTASVLAAVAASPPKEGRELVDAAGLFATRIVGIANQRVKECNRIQAMIDQLGKNFGAVAIVVPNNELQQSSVSRQGSCRMVWRSTASLFPS